ncbi:hypothetical protein [Aestuariivita sp.]|jgi:hypothetical protein|uniref:hypothetical protein n=1 Tax=Aestuariivita sp. TaxID=1872407 RepID=UPI00216CE424|nr:hypothetical protein [Aestuariivita sp.]MCE8006972.1 hypothetical protein [Aestuariivita sp.]
MSDLFWLTTALLSAAGPGIGAIAAAMIFSTPMGITALLGIGVILFGAAQPPTMHIVARKKAETRS